MPRTSFSSRCRVSGWSGNASNPRCSSKRRALSSFACTAIARTPAMSATRRTRRIASIVRNLEPLSRTRHRHHQPKHWQRHRPDRRKLAKAPDLQRSRPWVSTPSPANGSLRRQRQTDSSCASAPEQVGIGNCAQDALGDGAVVSRATDGTRQFEAVVRYSPASERVEKPACSVTSTIFSMSDRMSSNEL
jgi:hypothetical protein